mgnify:CR=1 FL=1
MTLLDKIVIALLTTSACAGILVFVAIFCGLLIDEFSDRSKQIALILLFVFGCLQFAAFIVTVFRVMRQ